MKEEHSKAVRDIAGMLDSFADGRFNVDAHYAELKAGKFSLTVFCSKDGLSAKSFDFGVPVEVIEDSVFHSSLVFKMFNFIDARFKSEQVGNSC